MRWIAFTTACLIFAAALAGESGPSVRVVRGGASQFTRPLDLLIRIDAEAELAPSEVDLLLVPAGAPETAPGVELKGAFAKRVGRSLYFDVHKAPGLEAGRYDLLVRSRGAAGTGQVRLERAISLTADKLDVALVIDESFSMRKNDRERLRVSAAKLFAQLAKGGERIGKICAVAFNESARTLLPLSPLGSLDEFNAAADRIEATGSTDLDAALDLAGKLLAASTSPRKAIVLLTDGKDEPGRYEDAHRKFIGAQPEQMVPIFTIGLSERADEETLRKIAADTGAAYYKAPTSTDLERIFATICFTLESKAALLDQWASAAPDKPLDASIPVDRTVSQATFSAQGEGGALGFWVTKPDGSAAPVRSASGGAYAFADIWRPAPGAWQCRATPEEACTVRLSATATTFLVARPFPLREGLVEDEPFDLACVVAEDGAPIRAAQVHAWLLDGDRPVGEPLRLHDDGQHGDTAASDGVYAAQWPGVDGAGTRAFRIVATGKNSSGEAFRRQADVAAIILPRAAPRLWVSTQLLDFGMLYNGERATRSFQAKLLTTAPREIKAALTLTSDLKGVTLEPVAGAQASSRKLGEVAAAISVPADARGGSYAGKLVIRSDAGSAEIALTLAVTNPEIKLAAGRFEKIESGEQATATTTVSLAPRGAQPVRVEPFELKSADGAAIAVKVELSHAINATADPSPIALSLMAPDGCPTGLYRGELTAKSPTGAASVPVEIAIVKPSITVKTARIDFGDRKPGEVALMPIDIETTGLRARAIRVEASGPVTAPRGEIEVVPGKPLAVAIGLNVPANQPPGPIDGEVRVRTPLGNTAVPVTVNVVPMATFEIVRPAIDLGPIAVGQTGEGVVEIRSTIPAPQTIRLKVPPGVDDATPTVGSDTVPLPSGGTVRVPVAISAAKRAAVGVRRFEFEVAGPSLPAKFSLSGDIFIPAHDTFAVSPSKLDFGRKKPKTESIESFKVVSIIDESQRIIISRGGAVGGAEWEILGEKDGRIEFDLAAKQVVSFDVVCRVPENAERGIASMKVVLRGPSNPGSVACNVLVIRPVAGIGAEEESAEARRSWGWLALLIAVIVALLIVLVILDTISRLVRRTPVSPWVRYLTASICVHASVLLLPASWFAYQAAVHNEAILPGVGVRMANLGKSLGLGGGLLKNEPAINVTDEAGQLGSKPVKIDRPDVEAKRVSPEIDPTAARELTLREPKATARIVEIKKETDLPVPRLSAREQIEENLQAVSQKLEESRRAAREADAQVGRVTAAPRRTAVIELVEPRAASSSPRAGTTAAELSTAKPGVGSGPAVEKPSVAPAGPAAMPRESLGTDDLGPGTGPSKAPAASPSGEPGARPAVVAKAEGIGTGSGGQGLRTGLGAAIEVGVSQSPGTPRSLPQQPGRSVAEGTGLRLIVRPSGGGSRLPATPASIGRPGGERIDDSDLSAPRRVGGGGPVQGDAPAAGSATIGRIAAEPAGPAAGQPSAGPAAIEIGRTDQRRREVGIAEAKGEGAAVGIANVAAAPAEPTARAVQPREAIGADVGPAAVPAAPPGEPGGDVGPRGDLAIARSIVGSSLEPATEPISLEPTVPNLTPRLLQTEHPASVSLAPGVARPGTSELPLFSSGASGGGGDFVFTLGQYDGDWNCNPTALPHLAYQFERRVGFAINTHYQTVGPSSPKLGRCPFVLVTGHKDFTFTAAEIRALRQYLQSGGSLWADDCTDEMDLTFDAAFRREIQRVLPDAELVKLPPDHPIYSTCYDLRTGYMGYKIPPGDKYRLDYVEGIDLDGRTGVIYTRNDYGCGLEIDPNTFPLMRSLSDLSPEQMREGSTRMAINVLFYFLGSRGANTLTQRASESIRTRAQQQQAADAKPAQLVEEMIDDFEADTRWQADPDWGDPIEVTRAGDERNHVLNAAFRLGKEKKAVVSLLLLEQTNAEGTDYLIVEVTSELHGGAWLALGLTTLPDWVYYESAPAFVRPGANTVKFRLSAATFKCQDSDWQHTASVKNLNSVKKLTLLLYPRSSGKVSFDNIRWAAEKK